jgi:hypothetical protein
MPRALELLISGLATAAGLCAIIRPQLLKSSMDEQYTPSRARAAAVIILLGLCALIAILQYPGEPVDFFPA